MKNNEVPETIIQINIPEQKPVCAEMSVVAKAGRNMRKIFYITSLAGIAICFGSCTATGYVATEPSYVEYSRPPQPSSVHIWVGNDWVYSQQNHIYVQKPGYWEKPSHNRTYVSGYWQSSPQGQHWVPGHYQRNHR